MILWESLGCGFWLREELLLEGKDVLKIPTGIATVVHHPHGKEQIHRELQQLEVRSGHPAC